MINIWKGKKNISAMSKNDTTFSKGVLMTKKTTNPAVLILVCGYTFAVPFVHPVVFVVLHAMSYYLIHPIIIGET